MDKEYRAVAHVIGNEVIFYFGDENSLTKCMTIDLSQKNIVTLETNIVTWEVTGIKLGAIEER